MIPSINKDSGIRRWVVGCFYRRFYCVLPDVLGHSASLHCRADSETHPTPGVQCLFTSGSFLCWTFVLMFMMMLETSRHRMSHIICHSPNDLTHYTSTVLISRAWCDLTCDKLFKKSATYINQGYYRGLSSNSISAGFDCSGGIGTWVFLRLQGGVCFSMSWVWRPCWAWRWRWSRRGRSPRQCWSVPSLCSRTSADCGPEQSPRNPATWKQQTYGDINLQIHKGCTDRHHVTGSTHL